MILDAVFACFFVLLVGCILYTMFHKLWHKEPVKGEARVAKMEASVQVPDSWVFIRYRGMVLPMRAIEKTEIWDNLSREGRNEQIDAMKKAVRQGKVRAHQLDVNTCVYLPLTADLKRIEAEYRVFKANGGKLD